MDELDLTDAENKENAKQPQSPPEKETAIKKALQHFGMM